MDDLVAATPRVELQGEGPDGNDLGRRLVAAQREVRVPDVVREECNPASLALALEREPDTRAPLQADGGVRYAEPRVEVAAAEDATRPSWVQALICKVSNP